MRRNALCTGVCLSMVVMLAGCAGNKAGVEAGSLSGTDAYSSAIPGAADPADVYPSYGQTVPMERAADPPAEPAVAPRRLSGTTPQTTYHTVTKNDTLFSLARLYYNDASRWRDIFRANGALISDPNKIRIGDRLLIP